MQNDAKKLDFLQIAPVRDAQTQEIKELAFMVQQIARRTPTECWTIAHLCHVIARDCVAYVLDGERVGREQIDGFTDPQGSATAALTRGTDDCDAKARLFVALCLACGLQAEIVPEPAEARVRAGAPLTHVFARVKLPKRTVTPKGAREEPEPWEWLQVETILARAVVGGVPRETPREVAGPHAGKWLYT